MYGTQGSHMLKGHDETAVTVLIPDDILEQVKLSLQPDNTLQELIIRALNVYLTLTENQGNRLDTAVYFDQIGILKPRITLFTKSLKDSIAFYCQLGFQIHSKHLGLLWISLVSRGLVLILIESTRNIKTENESIDINFTSNTNLEFLAEQLKDIGMIVDEENIFNNIDAPEITVLDPDGRKISIWSDIPTESDSWL
ncbi:VOC family protein [Deinococcus sp. KNUC1210]|uniref:VOC family protein n=1 Tax=Deinococcus sp. KNUC1210 TaxID=2917691 RepID=UPI001EF0E4EF|nr:VOC family protein [Deinococcus sp. KNUC1210]ULH15531.1 VOC family protein [Deinococcus sp. KNUC1210]